MFFGLTLTALVVALLAEGVDRNTKELYMSKAEIVALLAEGVDRNTSTMWPKSMEHPSPSSRRAWIEISRLQSKEKAKEGRPPRGGRG